MQRNVAKQMKKVSGAGGRYALFLLIHDVSLSHMQLTVDDLQTEMIAETNRKRRKLERERRALERPQPSTYTVLFSS